MIVFELASAQLGLIGARFRLGFSLLGSFRIGCELALALLGLFCTHFGAARLVA